MSTELLERHLPRLRYDSAERWFACSAAVWTDAPGQVLARADGTLLAAAPQAADTTPPGTARLSLGWLGPERYADDRVAARGDHLLPGDGALAAVAALQHDPAYADRVHGRAVRGSDGRLWLQYWCFFPYNDYTLLGPLIGAGRHQGDWEMLQLRMGADGQQPELALYAQHSRVGRRPWAQVEREGSHPVVYVARGCHASWFAPGRPWTGAWWDRADGRGRAPEGQLVVLGAETADLEAAGQGWVRWPGRWGSTRRGGGLGARLGLDSVSPHGPGHQRQWRDPAVLLPVR